MFLLRLDGTGISRAFELALRRVSVRVSFVRRAIAASRVDRRVPRTIASAPQGKWLYVAPEQTLMRNLLAHLPRERVMTTNLFSEDVRRNLPAQDLQRLSIPDASFAGVVCNHVLEHVADDRAAIAELAPNPRTWWTRDHHHPR